ncbi:Tyrosine-protein phosphatase [Streptomyces hundungensis]|uniref:Tyrosine-protein phosphatase n=1 Tax=Streptomyces hundungensis TaxID=1077946 RepID=A0A387HI28_9ACTN|nr:tyrosine-protein phosphatase [Streptomyces hundungensis]AYG83515.1 Tyrosine-protein phosphatase [Streptomyces hundungensis]
MNRRSGRTVTRARAMRAGAVTAALAATLALGLPATASASASAPPTTQGIHRQDAPAIRQVVLQGAVNVRDLGGYGTYDGEPVRYGLAYRADALNRTTDGDLSTLARLGLREVADFRTPLELQYDGPDRLPAGLAPASHPVTDSGLYAQMLAAIGSRDPATQDAMLGHGRAEALMRAEYQAFVSDPAARAEFGAVLKDLASARGPLLFHCTSGKDRTGWESYVLLRALGVPAATAQQDYLASNGFRAAADAALRAALKQSGTMRDPDLLIPLQEVRLDYLDAALDQLTALYGDLYGYLTQGLGLDLRDLAALRARLVT